MGNSSFPMTTGLQKQRNKNLAKPGKPDRKRRARWGQTEMERGSMISVSEKNQDSRHSRATLYLLRSGLRSVFSCSLPRGADLRGLGQSIPFLAWDSSLGSAVQIHAEPTWAACVL